MNKNISAAILIVVAIGIYFTITDPMITAIKAVQAVNDQYISALTHAEKLISMREAVLKQYNDISAEDRAKIEKMIPSSVDNIRLTIDLNSRALQRGFSLSGINATVSSQAQKNNGGAVPQTTPRLNNIQSTSDLSAASLAAPILDPISVSFGGNVTFDQLKTLLQDLEADLRIMDLTHLSMSYTTGGLYNFTAQYQTYWLRQ